jgi:WD40 repeat protein
LPHTFHYLVGAGILATLIFGIAFLLNRVSSVAGARETFSPVGRIRPLTSLAAETSEPAFSSDGNYVAFRSEGAKPQEGASS